MQAILLCGGMGTRLRSVVADRPKPMADICGKPFLQYLLEMLRDKGITEVIFALGYMGEMIEEYFQDGSAFGLKITYSYEEEPLGTGGAIRNALPKILEEEVLVLNADTYFPMDYQGLLRFHQEMTEISVWLPERCRIFPATVLCEEMQQAGFWHGMRSWEMVLKSPWKIAPASLPKQACSRPVKAQNSRQRETLSRQLRLPQSPCQGKSMGASM